MGRSPSPSDGIRSIDDAAAVADAAVAAGVAGIADDVTVGVRAVVGSIPRHFGHLC